MKIVIDIPKYVYDTIVASDGYIADCDNEKVGIAVKNGTPLPKGHGRLIDRNEVIKSLFDYHNGKKTIGQCIDDVPTIIEAGRGKKNETD